MTQIKGLLVLLVSGLFLSGCMTTDPYTGESKFSNAGIGSTVGAIGGAITGALVSNDKTKGALIGAGIGGIAGAGVGFHMDKQERELRNRLAKTGVSIKRDKNKITLVMPGDITFAKNSANINSRFYKTMQSIGTVLKKYDRTMVNVAGYTSNTGKDAYNQELSEKRAKSVSKFLRTQGVNSRRLIARGYGKRYPVATNATLEGRALNRRVNIVLSPIPS